MLRLALLVLVGLLLAPFEAGARFVLLDAVFDDQALWEPLDRRGARYDEPILGPHDFGYEYVNLQSGTDYSLFLLDLLDDAPHRLTWSFKNNVEVADGRLRVSVDLIGDGDGYDLIVDGPDPGESPFVRVILEDGGTVLRVDGDSPVPAACGSWTSLLSITVVVDFDLDAGTYDLILDGVTAVNDEPYGITDYGIARIHMGHRNDGNFAGSLDIDNLFVDWKPGAATQLFRADFDGEPLGLPIGTGGAALGQPTDLSNCAPTVVTGGFPTPSLSIRDESTTSAGSARFEFLNDREITDGDVSLSLLVYMNSAEGYTISLRENGSAGDDFLTLTFSSNGFVYFGDGSAVADYFWTAYPLQTPIKLEMAYDMDHDRYSIWMDGERVVHRKSHGEEGRALGALLVGYAFDSNLDGQIRVDNIKVDELPVGVSAVAERGHDASSPLRLDRVPNPLPRTGLLPVETDVPGRLRVDIVDVSGRQLRTLSDDAVAAGAHALPFDGRDDRGRELASGLYFVRARLDGAAGATTVARKIALVRAGWR